MNPVWNEVGRCQAKEGDRCRGTIRRRCHLSGKSREAGEVFEFRVLLVPGNKFQTQHVTIEDERFPLGETSFRSEAEAKGETLFPWDVINTEILETRE